MVKLSGKPKVQTALLLSILIGSVVLVGCANGASQIEVTVDSGTVIKVNELSLGFDLSSEWRIWRDSSGERNLARDAGFKLIRFVTSDVEPCRNWNESTETGTFSWSSVDSFLQRIFEIGAEPLICIGFASYSGVKIPPGMAFNPSTGLPYPDSFAAYCRAWVSHVKAMGFAVRFYEVFNEAWSYFYPNWNFNSVKTGYFLQVFNACYDAMHQVNPQILIGNDASLHRKFLDYWIAHGGKLDLLTFHKYDCDGLSVGDQTPLQRADQRFFVTDELYYGLDDARQLWFNAHGVTLPAIASELNWAGTSGSGTDPRIQKVVGAVWLALVLEKGMLEDLDYTAYFSFSSSESWELANKRSGGFGFGMVNQDNNKPWDPYLVQELIGSNLAVADQIVETTSSSSDIRPLAWTHGGTLNLLLVCKVDQPRAVTVTGLDGLVNYSKIDNTVSYESPRVQTGTSDSKALLSLNGYTVILLQEKLNSSTPPTPTPTPAPVNSTSAIFQDDFESGDFSAWSGTYITRGEVATVVNDSSSDGSPKAMFSSNGRGGFEYAYCYANIEPSAELYAHGYFMVGTSGITENGDRFCFIRFMAGNNSLAYAGWCMVQGVIRWNLMVRNGAGYADAYSDSTPNLNQWYSVELQWAYDSEKGLGELYVDGDLVCSLQNGDTTNFGNVESVPFGLAEAYNCSSTTVYCHDCDISGSYNGPAMPWDVNQDGKINILDIAAVAQALFSTPETPNWNPRADLNGDGVVNIVDLTIDAIHLSEEYS
jgi:hypothetical protein